MSPTATPTTRPEDGLAVFEGETDAWRLAYAMDSSTLRVTSLRGPHPTGAAFLWALDTLRHEEPFDRLQITPEIARRAELDTRAWHRVDEILEIALSAFLQLREPWLDARLWNVPPEVRREADCPGGWHPRRPRVPDGCLYRKHLAATGEVFELHRARLDEHGEPFHRWQNTPHVAEAWNEEGTREEHDAYLRERREDPHVEPLVGTLDGTPFAYVEVYWAREDRIGPHCDPGPYDQGLHLLVGEPSFLGGGRTAAWMRATFHFMFLREPRTTRLVGEPDAGNDRVIGRLRETGWSKQGEFEFPHKRAALLTLDRHAFFGRQHP